MKTIVRTFKEHQRKTGKRPYYCRRKGISPTDTAGFDGSGNKENLVGMICYETSIQHSKHTSLLQLFIFLYGR